MSEVYVLVPLGTSPAIATETLWHLAVAEGHRVRGVELWVTDGSGRSSAARLEADLRAGLWERFLRCLGEARERIPPLADPYVVLEPRPSMPPFDRVAVLGFRRDGRPLPDVRDPRDAEAVADQLHARVRALVRALGDTVLVGSIAGGRKTFGAALQGAFELQARPTDRLVHVLLHERLESDRAVSERYVAPDGPILGVAPHEQLAVFDVPFPPLRHLVRDRVWLASVERDDVTAIWGSLRRNVRSASIRAALERDGRGWRVVVRAGDEEVAHVAMSGGQAETYAALVAVPPDERERDGWEAWADWIGLHPLGRRRDGPIGKEAMYKRLQDVARATRPLVVLGYGAFAVHGRGQQAHVPARDRVAFAPDEGTGGPRDAASVDRGRSE